MTTLTVIMGSVALVFVALCVWTEHCERRAHGFRECRTAELERQFKRRNGDNNSEDTWEN